MMDSADKVQELTRRMEEMLLKQQELEAHNALLQHTCNLTQFHFSDLVERRVCWQCIGLYTMCGRIFIDTVWWPCRRHMRRSRSRY